MISTSIRLFNMVAALNHFSTVTDRKQGKSRTERKRIRAVYKNTVGGDMGEWLKGQKTEFLPDALAENETTEAGSGVGMFMCFLGEAIKKS